MVLEAMVLVLVGCNGVGMCVCDQLFGCCDQKIVNL